MSGTLQSKRGAVTYARPASVVGKIAAADGRSEGGVSQDLYGGSGCFRAAERMLDRLVTFGGQSFAQRQLERFQTIVAKAPVIPFSDALVIAESRADAADDAERTAMIVALANDDPSDDREQAIELIRRKRVAIARAQELVASLCIRYGVR